MITDLLGIAGLTILIMISPGPDLALVARNTVVGGKSAGGWTSAGILTGNLVHITYCLLGVGLLIATSIVAFTIFKLAGGAYLIYLGIQSLRPRLNTTGEFSKSAGHRRKWWVQGLLNNLLNPKGPLFYLGVFAVFVHPESTVVNLLLIVVTMMSIGTGFWVMFVYVLQISSVRNHLLDAGQWVNRILGTVLITLGIRLWLAEGPN